MSDNINKFCARCGSVLVMLNTTTKQLGKSTFPQTVSSFRCTNEVCQAEIDKNTADLAQQRMERAAKVAARVKSS